MYSCVKEGLLKLTILHGVCPGVCRVLAIEVSTPKDLTAVNGTDVHLKCTFKSSHPVSEKLVSVSWSFKPLGPGMEEQVRMRQER